VRGAAVFQRGEGTWFDSGIVYIATTHDSKIHAYDTRTERIEVIYDRAKLADPPLTQPDNITVSPSGDLFVCEDGGEDDAIDIALLAPDRTVSKFLSLVGSEHKLDTSKRSEACGVVFDPSGTRMLFASQRAKPPGEAPPDDDQSGAVYEVTGPFRLARPTSGPKAPGETTSPATVVTIREPGQAVGSGQGASSTAVRPPAPALGVEVPRRARLATARRRGLPVALTLDEPATVSVAVSAHFAPARRTRGRSRPRRSTRRLGKVRRQYGAAGPQLLLVPLRRDAIAALRGRRAPLRVVVAVTITDRDGERETFERTALLTAGKAS
jgi:hypothetical protein